MKPPPAPALVLVPETQVAARYGVVPRTLARWDLDPDLGFPPPVVIRRRRYRSLAELEAWDAKQRSTAA
jgi:hypothetical protein